ncbi:hypothetical protein [Lyticum sinuosum]|uniref:Uncharacterized protein n=1 Tax=Lyticum sinuosum TaxID=1332059 RepID=A0AAE4VKX2_9RICK|nr:hypothetical protein [Lyticum sinuosum]MDZ5760912.1 hypothetical protein [Lyticum sinuosum]
MSKKNKNDISQRSAKIKYFLGKEEVEPAMLFAQGKKIMIAQDQSGKPILDSNGNMIPFSQAKTEPLS